MSTAALQAQPTRRRTHAISAASAVHSASATANFGRCSARQTAPLPTTPPPGPPGTRRRQLPRAAPLAATTSATTRVPFDRSVACAPLRPRRRPGTTPPTGARSVQRRQARPPSPAGPAPAAPATRRASVAAVPGPARTDTVATSSPRRPATQSGVVARASLCPRLSRTHASRARSHLFGIGRHHLSEICQRQRSARSTARIRRHDPVGRRARPAALDAPGTGLPVKRRGFAGLLPRAVTLAQLPTDALV